MSIYAISDLHLSLAPGIHKPMDIFGPRWYNHVERVENNWRNSVKAEDTVIVAGDISWALKLNEARHDLDWVDSLPGHKVFFKGNHDLWWAGITKLNKMYETIAFVQNDSYEAEGFAICGTRGWLTPDHDEFTAEDEKIYKRELLRLESSLAAAPAAEIIGVLHFPPVSKPSSFSAFQQLFEDYGVKRVLYGHIHGEDKFRNTILGNHHGIDYQLISVDYLNCKPLLIQP